MKIAISGSQDIGKEKLVKDFIIKWTNYSARTDKPYILSEMPKFRYEIYNKILDNMKAQYEAYSSDDHILFFGSPIDVFCNAIVDNFNNVVNNNQLEDIFKKGRSILSLLDANFIITQYDEDTWNNLSNTLSSEDQDRIGKVNLMYGNLLHEYYTEFDADIFFPKNNCPGIIPLESTDYILEISGLINDNGDQYSSEDNKKLNENMMTLVSDSIEEKRRQQRENLLEVQERLLGEEQAKKLKI